MSNTDHYSEYLLDEENQVFSDDLRDSGKQLMRYFMIKLGSASIAYPFETAKILRQCQVGNLPDPKIAEPITSSPEMNIDTKDMIKEAQGLLTKEMKSYSMETDDSGYVKTPNALSASQWPISLDKTKGIGGSCLVIARRQGLLSLWNGLIPFWLHRIAFDVTKATLEETLDSNEAINGLIDNHVPVLMNKIDFRPSIIPICAQAVAGVLLSPLELIHTRLAVQSIYKTEKSYNGTIDAARKIYRNEGGLSAFFPSPLFTILTKTLQPILRIIPSTAFAQYFEGFVEDANFIQSIALLIGQFAALSISPLVMVPLETVRRRLMIQPNTISTTGYGTFYTRVPVSEKRYTSAFDCFVRIVRDEGLSSLYQGLSLQLTSNVLMVAVDLATEFDEDIPDDIEEF